VSITTAAIRAVIESGGPNIVYQPIVSLARNGPVVGYEALSRFAEHTPDLWFAAAWQEGLGLALEFAALDAAIRHFRAALGGFRRDLGFLAVNLTPKALLDEGLRDFIVDTERDIPIHVVIEMSEAQMISDYTSIRQAVEQLRDVGVMVSIDDLGAGYSSLLHVVHLHPEYLKVDMQYIARIPDDRDYIAMVHALVTLGHDIGAQVIAEGVERKEQADALRILAVPLAQGWHFGVPGPLPAAR